MSGHDFSQRAERDFDAAWAEAMAKPQALLLSGRNFDAWAMIGDRRPSPAECWTHIFDALVPRSLRPSAGSVPHPHDAALCHWPSFERLRNVQTRRPRRGRCQSCRSSGSCGCSAR